MAQNTKVEVLLNLQTQLSPIPLTPHWKHPPSFLTSQTSFLGLFCSSRSVALLRALLLSAFLTASSTGMGVAGAH